MGRTLLLTPLFFLLLILPWMWTPSGAQAPDIAEHRTCQYCGMDRRHYAHSRMLIVYEDGTASGACSIYCAAIDLAVHNEKTPVDILVADYDTHELVDAEKAHWVIGGNRPGVMTKRAKWAFRSKEAALAFVRTNGGVPASFDDVIKATYLDMFSDSKMIRAKRKLRQMHQ